MMKMLQKLQIILLALLGGDMTNNYKKNIGLPEIVGDNIGEKWVCFGQKQEKILLILRVIIFNKVITFG